MNDNLNQLVANAKTSPDAFWPLVDALRLAASGDPFVLLTFARSPNKVERKAAAAACGGQTDPAIVAALVNLAADAEIEVRIELGYNLKNWPRWSEIGPAIEKLLTDFDINIRQNAVWAVFRIGPFFSTSSSSASRRKDLWVCSEIALVLGGCPAICRPRLLTRADDSISRAAVVRRFIENISTPGRIPMTCRNRRQDAA